MSNFLFTEEEFQLCKSREFLTLSCTHCKKVFQKKKHQIQAELKKNENRRFYCSRECFCEGQKVRVKTSCSNCGTLLSKTSSKLKYDNAFCSRSCAATYNNKHKKHGTRRSKLEIYLEKELRKEFPDLELICNGKEAIGSELDFYFPELRFAIELNGIFHYEPIYGQDKLERIQNNDRQKLIRCYKKGIELAIVDSSSVSYLSTKAKEKYLEIVRSLIVPLLERKKWGR
mgnify:FL=1